MACCFAVQLVMGVSSAPVLREEASSSRRSFEDQVRLPLAPLHSFFNARALRPRLIAQAGLARRRSAQAGLGFIAAKPKVRVPLSCGVSHI